MSNIDAAERHGIAFDWRHARTGVPPTLTT
jgi:hypothetical protein